jgi:hypothetical protein
VQGGDGDAALIAAQRGVDQRQRLLAAHEMGRDADGDIGKRHRPGGRRDPAGSVEGAEQGGARGGVAGVVAE